MKIMLLILCCFFPGLLSGQQGIIFSGMDWETAKKEAVRQEKLIFIDVYTQWCGPCLMMAQEVFVLPEVARFYNEHFLNLKIDAETEEWGPLAARYGVRSYPTYLFIDPVTEELVHFSGSRQDAETFLFTGASALNRELNSGVLKAEYEKGNGEPEFLIRYARYTASVNARNTLERVMEKLTHIPGYGLENEEVWNLFVKHIFDKKNPLSVELLKDISRFRALYGVKAVDAKLYGLMNYTPDLSLFDRLPDFEGKDFLIRKNRIDLEIRSKRYEEADRLITELLAEPGNYLKDICDFLRFTVAQAQYQEMPEFWFNRCLIYARYIAYNYPERDNGMMHYNYAVLLEKLIRSIPEVSRYFPEELTDKPAFGEKEYTMRPPELKQKPTRKR